MASTKLPLWERVVLKITFAIGVLAGVVINLWRAATGRPLK